MWQPLASARQFLHLKGSVKMGRRQRGALKAVRLMKHVSENVFFLFEPQNGGNK